MVVVIIAILAAAAMPLFQKTAERARAQRAVVMLRAIRNAEETAWVRLRRYTTNWAELDMAQPQTGDFTYALASASTTDFLARATRAGSPSYAVTIDSGGCVLGVPGTSGCY